MEYLRCFCGPNQSSDLGDPVTGDGWRDALVAAHHYSARYEINRYYPEAFALCAHQPLFAWVPEWTAALRTIADLPRALARAMQAKIRRVFAELFVRGAPAVVGWLRALVVAQRISDRHVIHRATWKRARCAHSSRC